MAFAVVQESIVIMKVVTLFLCSGKGFGYIQGPVKLTEWVKIALLFLHVKL